MATSKKLNIINSRLVSKSNAKFVVIGSSIKNTCTCGCVFVKHLQKDSMEDKYNVELCQEHSKLYLENIEASFSPSLGVFEIFHNKISILRAELDMNIVDIGNYWNEIIVDEQPFSVRLCRSDDDGSHLVYIIPVVGRLMMTEMSERLTLKILDA